MHKFATKIIFYLGNKCVITRLSAFYLLLHVILFETVWVMPHTTAVAPGRGVASWAMCTRFTSTLDRCWPVTPCTKLHCCCLFQFLLQLIQFGFEVLVLLLQIVYLMPDWFLVCGQVICVAWLCQLPNQCLNECSLALFLLLLILWEVC